jgi:regulator of sigma D
VLDVRREKLCLVYYIIKASRITNLNKLLNTLGEFQKNLEEIPKIYFSTRNNTKNVFENFSEQINTNINNDRPYFEGLDYIE